MTQPIALVGMACRYPDARSPVELWENVLARRQAFRRLPTERLELADYGHDGPDGVTLTQAAVLEGWRFDRLRFRVTGDAFRAADPTHWLALETAALALDDAGFPEGRGLPRESTGVLVGNTLTGEFTRAGLMRLRWPYVRRVVEARLEAMDWTTARRAEFLEALEGDYKAPFPVPGAETLAGGLSNTIAGRICNHFDLGGGGYTLDGACCSSLLAVANACSALVAGDLDLVLAGGVDLSLDPFELVGFSRAGALAQDEMRVFDRNAAGFWPGEGCGFVVLMRLADARSMGRRPYGVIRGWGIASDGSGGITRPEVEGQRRALERAYHKAGYGADSVALFEAHGTGTGVGDPVELKALAAARGSRAMPAAVGSIKANIGHTKAAAGAAGLIKAALAVQARLLPPVTGLRDPHPLFQDLGPSLYLPRDGRPWRHNRPLRAGVSSFGFGGIDVHLTLEADGEAAPSPTPRLALASHQDAELFLLGGEDPAALIRLVDTLGGYAERLSRAELIDLAAALIRRPGEFPLRAALVAATPDELARNLASLRRRLVQGETAFLDPGHGLFAGADALPIALLFPGQAAPVRLAAGAWGRRFPAVAELYRRAALPRTGDAADTALAQPAIIAAELAGLRVLTDLGVGAAVAVGHSLGELTALHWAGCLDEAPLLELARVRGAAMAGAAGAGAMAAIGADGATVTALLAGRAEVVIAGHNSPRQTVVAGTGAAVDQTMELARQHGLTAHRLPVSRAFHSPAMGAAATALQAPLARVNWRPPQRRVVSTVTGGPLGVGADLGVLLKDQLTHGVRFTEALDAALPGIGLCLEVGPGQVLSGLLAERGGPPALSMDAAGPALRPLLLVLGAAWAANSLDRRALDTGRFSRPFELDWRPLFLANPCEAAPRSRPAAVAVTTPHRNIEPPVAVDATDLEPLELVRRLVAAKAELPLEAVGSDSRLLADLHLNSMSVGEVVVEASRVLGLAAPVAATEFAEARPADIAHALEEQRDGATVASEPYPEGLDTWVRPFIKDYVPADPPTGSRSLPGAGGWRVLAPPGVPLATALEAALAKADGGGVVLCLPVDAGAETLPLLLAAAAGVRERAAAALALVQPGAGAAAFVRGLFLESRGLTVAVLDLPPDDRAVDRVLAELAVARDYHEVRYEQGARRRPRWRVLPDAPTMTSPLGPEDLLLVSGGGKGIAAECALDLARNWGVRLALLGRSDPAADPELAANLRRFESLGGDWRYLAADVRDREAVAAALATLQQACGPVTALLHGAGRNQPTRVVDLDETKIRATLAPKLDGLAHLLMALDPERLRLLMAFGSVIAETGLPGEADYGLANQWLARAVDRYGEAHPRCRCLTLEWSVWSGSGMGERLGRIESLARAGITAITLEQGVAALGALLCRDLPVSTLVVGGRLPDTPTLPLERPSLPFLRFLEQPRVWCPGVELVAEWELNAAADLYLDDHALEGERLLPAVMGLEAMAQAASALLGRDGMPRFEQLVFARPIVAPANGAEVVRLLALAGDADTVELALRCASTGFKVDHFRGRCRFGAATVAATPLAPEAQTLDLDPARDLYGSLLFQRGRFRRLLAYQHLQATACRALIGPGDGQPWFARYLPDTQVLGDPGARDAAIHAVQACIPMARLLPVGVERLDAGRLDGPGPWTVTARERWQRDRLYCYDLDLFAANGRHLERWEGLTLRRIAERDPAGPWSPTLLAVYLERRLAEAGAKALALTLEPGAGRGPGRERAVARLLGPEARLARRPDGKPLPGAGDLSLAHVEGLTLAVAGPVTLACDLEPVRPRDRDTWRGLLGEEGWGLAVTLSGVDDESWDSAATRVWSARECLKKAGLPVTTPLSLVERDGPWTRLAAGDRPLVGYRASLAGRAEPLIVTVLWIPATGRSLDQPVAAS